MKGWVAEHRERLAAQEQEQCVRIRTMRRQHVQNYLKGFDGFCPWCGVVFVTGQATVHGDGCRYTQPLPSGRPRRLLIREWEGTTLLVNVNGKQVETPTTGWTRRTVRNQTVWTKTVSGSPVLLHDLEARQAGVVFEKDVDPTSLIPSASTTWTVPVIPTKVATVPPRKATPRVEKGNVVNLDAWSIDKQLSQAAAKLSAPSDRANQLRRQHVAKYGRK